MALPTPLDVLELFAQVADRVGSALAEQSDWGESGRRPGQYNVDLVVDQLCTAPLLAAGYRVLSEESGLQGPDGAQTVVVDPLDGSTNASRQIPWFATALCLVDGDGPSVATVANHATGQRFTAARGGGAHCDGRPIMVSDCADLRDAIIGVSGLPTHHYGWAQFRAFGAAAPDLCLVASGALDGWCDMSDDAHGVWDYLAGVLICQEAGGVAVDLHGRDLSVVDHSARRTPVVAASDELVEALVANRTTPPDLGDRLR